jgi:hypothetical protein
MRVNDCTVSAKRQADLIAEVLRDVGILFFVFGPFDTLLQREHLTLEAWSIAGMLAIVGLLLIVVGITIDARGDSS